MMTIMRKRLACCTRDRVPSLDMDEPERIMTYNGLESFILNSHPYENESHSSRGDGCPTDSLDEDASSCSSSKDVYGSFSSKWLTLNTKKDEHGLNEWEISESPQHYYVKEKPGYSVQSIDVEVMKERFSKLLLGEDVTGGKKGLSSALALSNAITNLAVSVFGELWKLEPLSEERKVKWQQEMDWLLSPTKYMVELVPTRQSSANGQTLEIMTPKARADIHMNLPALQKLDSMLIETLDSMVDKEFWYAEGGSRAEGRTRGMNQSRRWWLPSPQVPKTGLSDPERKKLLHQAKVVHQVFKAAKSINENVLMEMPVPTGIRDALAKPGKASLGEELYRVLTSETSSAEMLSSLNLKSEHGALEAINRLESAVLSWKQRINEQASGKTPLKTSWSLIRDSMSELDNMECIQYRAEALLQQLKTQYPNLPQSFLEVAKIQYGKDIGHSILEAYSRVLGNLASSILGRMRDILQEDIVSNPNSPISTTSCFPGITLTGMAETPLPSLRIRHSLIDQMNMVDGRFGHPVAARTSLDCEASISDSRRSSVMATPSRSRVWCIGREACGGLTPRNSP